MKFFNKKWFTLTELIVAVVIGAVILIFIFQFVVDIIRSLSDTNRKAQIFTSFYEFTTKIDNYKNTFPKLNLFINNSSSSWNDVVVLRNIEWNYGLMIGVVDKTSMKLAKNSTYPFYTEKMLWYRELTQANLTEISWDASKIYDYTFFKDKVFDDLLVKNFQADIYNTWSILNMDVYLLLDFSPDLLWSEWNSLSQEDVYKINLNF